MGAELAGETSEQQAIAEQARAAIRPNHSLPAYYYTSPQRYSNDVLEIRNDHWLLAGHVSEVPDAGSYFLFELAGESIIVCRDKAGGINAFYNVCRHRGSRVCLEKSGKTRLFVCPYHSWSYDLNGNLKHAKSMPPSFDKATASLVKANIGVFDGLIFINLNRNACPDFNAFCRRFRGMAADYDLPNTKVIDKQSITFRANWKLAVENFLECYHCTNGHPSWSKINSVALTAVAPAGDLAKAGADTMGTDVWIERCKKAGRFVENTFQDDFSSPYLQAAHQSEIGFGSETTATGGKLVSSLLGNFTQVDGGKLIFVMNPFTLISIFPDYVVIVSFYPDGATQSRTEVRFLVRGDAIEGVDYTVDNVCEVFRTVVAEDKRLVENNQVGVESAAYEPGTYSLAETRVSDFVDWYVKHFLDKTDRGLEPLAGSRSRFAA